MRKPTKKQKAKSDIINLIMSYALNEEDVNYFIYDLEEAELRSIRLVTDVLKMEGIVGKRTELEDKLLKLPTKDVFAVIKELRKKFPYVPAS